MVGSGKENGEIILGIKRKKIISNEQLRREFIYEENRKSLSKGHLSIELSKRFENEFCQYPGLNLRREFGKELSIDSRESSNNQERVFKHDADRRGRVESKPQFSLTKKIKGIDENAVPIKLQSAIIDFVVKDVDNKVELIQESIKSHEQLVSSGKVPPNLVAMFEKDLKELKENERRSLLQQKSIQEQRRTFDNNSNKEWKFFDTYAERL